MDARIAQFWNKVDRSGGPDACWPWTGGVIHSTGYGQATTIRGLPGSPAGKQTTAHRQAWIITNGDPGTHVTPNGNEIPTRVRHRCPSGPNRLCCNPAHLSVGTDKDNADDRTSDGNTFRGERVTISKLTDDAVRDARKAYRSGESITSLARRYGVHVQTMAPAIYGVTWAHVDPDEDRPRPRPRPAKLTPDAVRRIRTDKAAGRSYAALAAEHGVAVATIQAIIARQTWAHVPEEAHA